MKRNLLVTACLSVIGLAAHCQTQLINGSFDTWESKTCGTNSYEEPKGLTPFIGACVSVNTGVDQIYSLNLHTLKVQGAAAGSSAVKLINTQGSGTNVNSYAAIGITGGITKIPTSIDVYFKSDIKLSDSVSINFFAYSGDGSMADFMNKASESTHTATAYISSADNKSNFSKINISLTETGIAGTPNSIAYMVNTKGNKTKSYIANINSSIIIDEIKLNYGGPTATILLLESMIQYTSDFQASSLNVYSDVAWTATSDASWLRITKTNGAVGNTSFSFALTENTGDERIGTITFSGEGAKSKKLTIIQENGNKGSGLGIVEPKFPLSYEANSTDNLIIKTSSSWKIVNAPSWLTLSSATGSGTTTVKLTASENTGTERSAVLTVIVPDVDTQTVEITQLIGKSVSTLTTDVKNLVLTDISDNAKKIKVTSNTLWVVRSYDNWLGVSINYGYGDSTIEINAMKNSGVERSSSITVSSFGVATITIDVVQSATGTYIKEHPVVTPEEPVVDPQTPTTTLSFQTTTESSVIYPNPANEQFFVKTDVKAVVTVYSQTNELLIKKTITSNSAIDISALAKGTYVVIVTSDEAQYKTSLIKQ